MVGRHDLFRVFFFCFPLLRQRDGGEVNTSAFTACFSTDKNLIQENEAETGVAAPLCTVATTLWHVLIIK